MSNVCPTCGKTYVRNSANFREHVRKCAMTKKPKLLDDFEGAIPTPKPLPPQVIVPKPEPKPAPKPIIRQPEIQPQPIIRKEDSNGGKMGAKALYMGAVVVQHSLNGTLKGFDDKIYTKRQVYADLIDEMLVKYGVNVNVPVEMRFASEISIDAFKSFQDRMNDPLPIARIQNTPQIRTAPPNITEKRDKFRDVDRLFD